MCDGMETCNRLAGAVESAAKAEGLTAAEIKALRFDGAAALAERLDDVEVTRLAGRIARSAKCPGGTGRSPEPRPCKVRREEEAYFLLGDGTYEEKTRVLKERAAARKLHREARREAWVCVLQIGRLSKHESLLVRMGDHADRVRYVYGKLREQARLALVEAGLGTAATAMDALPEPESLTDPVRGDLIIRLEVLPALEEVGKRIWCATFGALEEETDELYYCDRFDGPTNHFGVVACDRDPKRCRAYGDPREELCSHPMSWSPLVNRPCLVLLLAAEVIDELEAGTAAEHAATPPVPPATGLRSGIGKDHSPEDKQDARLYQEIKTREPWRTQAEVANEAQRLDKENQHRHTESRVKRVWCEVVGKRWVRGTRKSA